MVQNQTASGGNDTNGDETGVSVDALQRATDYVVGFNMRGLHRIEREIFFPWVQKKVVESIFQSDRDMSSAVRVVMDRLDRQQQALDKLGQRLVRLA
jgi:hypothetical protein